MALVETKCLRVGFGMDQLEHNKPLDVAIVPISFLSVARKYF
jgi:hypothetical protein